MVQIIDYIKPPVYSDDEENDDIELEQSDIKIEPPKVNKNPICEIDQYTFDTYTDLCQNIHHTKEPEGEQHPCAVIRINDEDICICSVCYGEGFRPCVYSGNIYDVTEMYFISPYGYIHKDFKYHFQPYIDNPTLDFSNFLNDAIDID